MQWYHYAFLTAITLGAADTLTKKAAALTDEYTLALVRMVYALPFVIPVFYFVSVPDLDITFYAVTAILMPIDVFVLILYQRAIKLSPLSLTLPMLAFTPVFTVITSYILLGEVPDQNSFIGIVLVFLGVYLLNIHNISKGIFEPVKSLKKEKGTKIMFFVAFIFSININLGKILANHSSPYFIGSFYIIAVAISLLIYLIISRKTYAIKNLKKSPILFLSIGIFIAISFFCHFIALTMTNVAYMVSVKRTSILFAAIFSALFLKEFYVIERLIGTTVMVAGVWFIIAF